MPNNISQWVRMFEQLVGVYGCAVKWTSVLQDDDVEEYHHLQLVTLPPATPHKDNVPHSAVVDTRDGVRLVNFHYDGTISLADGLLRRDDAVDTGGGKPTCGTCEHWRLTADLGDCTEDADSVAPTLRHKADVCGSHQVRKPSTEDAVDTKGTNTCER